MTRLTRRGFLTGAAAGALGASIWPANHRAQAAGDEVIPLVDTHQHLWDLTRFKLPWLEGQPRIKRNYLLEEYAQATRGIAVDKTIYMEVDVAPEQQDAEARWVVELCQRDDNRLAGAVISGRPAAEGFPQYAARHAQSGYVKGVRQVLQVPECGPGYCLQKEFIAGIRALGELGLHFEICMRTAELADARRLTEACPDTQFVLNHCGNAQVQEDLTSWRKDIEALAGRPNLICKVSGIVASAADGTWTADDLAPVINHVIDSFGEDRLVFGSDWPVCTLRASYAQWHSALLSILADRSLALRRKLLHDNAIDFYRLS